MISPVALVLHSQPQSNWTELRLGGTLLSEPPQALEVRATISDFRCFIGISSIPGLGSVKSHPRKACPLDIPSGNTCASHPIPCAFMSLSTVERWQASGLTQADFCRREGITEWQLSSWKLKLKKKRKQTRQDSIVKQERAQALEFAPVTIVADDEDPGWSKVETECILPELEIVVVRIPAGTSLPAARHIIQAARSTC